MKPAAPEYLKRHRAQLAEGEAQATKALKEAEEKARIADKEVKFQQAALDFYLCALEDFDNQNAEYL